jgi:hypothetical protein
MVMYRQKFKSSSESSRYRRAGRLEIRAGRIVRQAGMESRKQARVKTGRTSKEKRKSSTGKNTLVDLTNIHDKLAQFETGNSGINTLGKISDTWRGWRQSQGQVKQMRV